ncbi:MAG: ComEC family competence protein, partial [Bacteroidetes bacterium]
PHQFDYARYMRHQNVHFRAYVPAREWHLLEAGFRRDLKGEALALRKRLLEVLENRLPDSQARAVVSAMTLGYRRDLPEELETAYARTGAMHVLAVSGLHVGVLFLLGGFLFRGLRRRGRWGKGLECLGLLLLVWAFAFLTGLSPSVRRAATMFSFLAVGRVFGRRANVYNTLAASAFWLLLIDPYLLFQVGFQLSYAAVAGIVFFQPRIARLWQPPWRGVNYLWQLTAVSLAAQLTTFPLSLYYFHQFPLFFLLSGWVVVPVATIVLPTTLGLFAAEFLSPGLAECLGLALQQLVGWNNAILYALQSLPSATVSGVWLDWKGVVTLFVLVWGVGAWSATRRFRWLLVSAFALLFVAASGARASWQKQISREVVLYRVPRNFQLDLFDRDHVLSLESVKNDPAAVHFAVANHRSFRGAKEEAGCALEADPEAAADWAFYRGWLQYRDLRILVLSPQTPLPETPTRAAALILTGSPDVRLGEVFQRVQVEEVIIHTENRRGLVQRWERECEELGVPCHSLWEEGAWVRRF